MTPTLAAALVRAQDVAHLMDWSEEPAARVVGWGRASLNQAGLALLPAGADRDTTGVWCRGWSVVHTSGEFYAWSAKSTTSDETRAHAEAYRCLLGMAVEVARGEAAAAPVGPAPWERTAASLEERRPRATSGSKRPFYMPVERSKKSAEESAAEFERMQAEAPWACGVEIIGQEAGSTSPNPPASPVHAEGVLPSVASMALPAANGPDPSGSGSIGETGEAGLAAGGVTSTAPVDVQEAGTPPATSPVASTGAPTEAQAAASFIAGLGAAVRVVHGLSPAALRDAQGGGPDLDDAVPDEAARDWSGDVETLGEHEDIDVPCCLCGKGFECGDRFVVDKASGVDFAHARCLKDAPKFNPIEPSCVDTLEADAVVVPGSRLGASLSLAQWVDSWLGAHESKARAKKGAPVLCEGCHEPIMAKQAQRERGSERVHVDCLNAGKRGHDPRKPKPDPLRESMQALASVGEEQAQKAGAW